MGFKMKNTVRGYNYYIMISAFQKFCRRGDAKSALWCFVELDESGYFSHVLNRLEVVIYEDVGLANKDLFFNGAGLIESIRVDKSKKRYYMLKVSGLIHEICQSRKSRICGELWQVVNAERAENFGIEIPDYCYDQHTSQGKKMGRGLKHFFEEAAYLERRDEGLDVYRKEAEASWLKYESMGTSAEKKAKEMTESGATGELFDE